MDCSTQCSSVHGFLQASKLEWFVISFSRGYPQPRDGPQVSCLSCIASEFFTTEPSGKPQVTPYANNGLCQCLWRLVMLGPEVLTQVMDFPFCGLFFFFPPRFMVPPSWTPLLLFLFFPNHLTDGYLLFKLKNIFFKSDAGTSLAVQWSKLCISSAGGRGWIPGGIVRAPMPWGEAKR